MQDLNAGPAAGADAVDLLGPGHRDGPPPATADRLGAPVYFCDSRSPWQRGTSESTNGLPRAYFPKGVTLANYSLKRLLAIEDELNQVPGWSSKTVAPRIYSPTCSVRQSVGVATLTRTYPSRLAGIPTVVNIA